MWHRIGALSLVVLMSVGCGALPREQASPSSPPPTTTAPSPAATSAAPTGKEDARPALGTTRSTLTPALQVDVVGLNRVAGKHLVAQVRLTNTGTEKELPWTGELGDSTRPLGRILWASGIGVLDAEARRWLLPYKPEGSPCLCTDQNRDGLGYFIEPGRSITVYAVLPAPSGNPASTTVVTPVGPPMLDVPISDDPPVTDGLDIPDPGAQPVTTLSHRLLLPSESLDRSEETADDGKDLQVSLSSDVLFAVDKADLTAKAKTVLARTAKLIDASTGPSVTVSGHADSSGTDAVNEPLSKRRAQAVQRALSGLVTRDRVRFKAEGYGSRKPLYSNDEEEGRRRNRRVTVAFVKPAPAQEPAAPSDPVITMAPGQDDLKASAKLDGKPFTLEVTGLRRLPGDLAVLTYRVTNDGDAEAWAHELGHSTEWMSYKYQAASNLRLTDTDARRKYLPGRVLVDADGGTDAYCACSETSGVRLSAPKFGPGETKEFWSLFGLPATVPSVSAKIATWPAIQVSAR